MKESVYIKLPEKEYKHPMNNIYFFSIFIKFTKDSPIYVLIYIDNLLITSPAKKLIAQFKTKLVKHFDLTNKGEVKRFLRTDIIRQDYIVKTLVKFSLTNLNSTSTPINKRLILVVNPAKATLKKIFHYLQGLKDLYIFFVNKRYYLTKGPATVYDTKNRIFKKQPYVATSITESKYIAQFTRLLTELRIQIFKPVKIIADNNGAIALTKNPVFHTNTKHISIRFYKIQEEVKASNIVFTKIPMAEMAADSFTKPLAHILFQHWVTIFNLRKLPDDILRTNTTSAALHTTDPHTSNSPTQPHTSTSSVENIVTNILSLDSSLV
ncbi:uncharacterized protein N7506_005312 [Penicillium brevicompactum]|uniref:uncharacterized protein n=1 Tax=Penicillium brevicompactum TaxID=5074 RepID=UPI0025426324|nr:uncharacterized protein N7506_005312 [Penicillium brevicompactum]KAJ5337290.1 hypothetical protein N7506_005312 [Penicillium brevicompactum]